MYISISKSGVKEEVVRSLRADVADGAAAEVNKVLADHIDQHAAAHTSVSVSLSGSVHYTK